MLKKLKYIGLFLLIILDMLLLFVCENTWAAWIVIGLSIVFFFIWKYNKKSQHIFSLVLILIAINILSFTLTKQVSVRGAVVSKIMAPLMAPTFAKEMLHNQADSIEMNKKYKAEQWNHDGYTLEKLTGNGVSIEQLSPHKKVSDKVIMEIHGGGFVVGIKNTYRDLAVRFSETANGATVVIPDYTTSDKKPYPAALNDCIKTYEWLLNQGYRSDNIIIAGDSAGGNLALALGLYLRDNKKPLPAGIITISAFANMEFNSPSYTENADKCILGKWFGAGNIDYDNFFYTKNCNTKLNDPYLSPVNGEYSGFPRLLMQVGSREIVLDDTKTIVQKVNASGGKAKGTIYRGMWHVFQITGLKFPEADQAWDEIDKFIDETFLPEK